MSLLLRKACQVHLDAIGLTSFHTGITEQKRLAIYTTCGKPFITIWGVSFNRTSPTNAEIEFASELFAQFLIRHQTAIEDYIDAYDKFHSLTPVESETAGISIRVYGDYIYAYFTSSIFKLKYGVKRNTGETDLHVVGTLTHTAGDMIGGYIRKDDYDVALRYLAKYITYDKQHTDLQDLESNLSKCDI